MLLKLNLFLNGLVTVMMLLIVTVIILRLIASYSKLNFFGWTYVTLRRLADPLITPVRLTLMQLRVDPKIAPVVTILIVLLCWWVLTTAVNTILGTIGNVISALQRQAALPAIGHLLIGLLSFYTLMIFVRIVCLWLMVSPSKRLMRFLYRTTEPFLAVFRRAIKPVGMFDVSALVAFAVLYVLQLIVAGLFLGQ